MNQVIMGGVLIGALTACAGIVTNAPKEQDMEPMSVPIEAANHALLPVQVVSTLVTTLATFTIYSGYPRITREGKLQWYGLTNWGGGGGPPMAVPPSASPDADAAARRTARQVLPSAPEMTLVRSPIASAGTDGLARASTFSPGTGGGGSVMELKSAVFEAGGMIPRVYTCDGQDFSPPLSWSAVPDGTKSLALIVEDPDAPHGTWIHWVAWNIPATARALEAHMPKRHSLTNGMKQGTSDFRSVGYGGPCPPSGTHRYIFKLYALDTTFTLPSSTTKPVLEAAMHGHVLKQTALMGTYSRRD